MCHLLVIQFDTNYDRTYDWTKHNPLILALPNPATETQMTDYGEAILIELFVCSYATDSFSPLPTPKNL